MTTGETAQFIQDRALSLHYEATRFPAAEGTVIAWLERAAIWAQHTGQAPLAAHLLSRIAQVRSARR